jgi:plastocyanin
MQVSRRAFTQLLGVMGLASASNAIAQGKVVDVTMHSGGASAFDPVDVHISVGDTVRWTNNDILVHTVTFDPKRAIKAADVALPAGVEAFGSADLNQDDTYNHTFTVKGTYKYICKYHEIMGMTGTIIVS